MRQDFKISTQRLNQQLLEMLFPTLCVGCREYGMLLCRNCWQTIDFLEDQDQQILSVCSTQQPLIQKILNALNCQLIKGLDVTCAEIMFKFLLERQKLPPEDFVISFVPIHQRKQAIQGFNPNEAIAKEFAKLLELPTLTLLKKTRENPNIYKACDSEGFKILLIGLSLEKDTEIKECAEALKEAGATEVLSLTFARDF